MTVTMLTGDCREILQTLPDGSVHCVVTSPPYWGLRDYGIGDDAFGLEPTYQLYVEHAVEIFREVRRVLRRDGTLWLNLGDSYATGTSSGRLPTQTGKHGYWQNPIIAQRIDGAGDGLKPKDLCGIPWRIAFALQADGWYLRQDLIWAKSNPMPESVTDRCTKAHEYIFLLSKSERYYYDAEAIKENVAPSQVGRVRDDVIGGKSWKEREQHSAGGRYETRKSGENGGLSSFFGQSGERAWRDGEGGAALSTRPEMARPNGRASGNRSHKAVTEYEQSRNRRSVWEIATAPFSEAHFATFPPALVEPCVLAGCPKGGTVLDPFGGAGTTGLVADRLGRNAILIELNPEYAVMAERRIGDDAGMFADVRAL